MGARGVYDGHGGAAGVGGRESPGVAKSRLPPWGLDPLEGHWRGGSDEVRVPRRLRSSRGNGAAKIRVPQGTLFIPVHRPTCPCPRRLEKYGPGKQAPVPDHVRFFRLGPVVTPAPQRRLFQLALLLPLRNLLGRSLSWPECSFLAHPQRPARTPAGSPPTCPGTRVLPTRPRSAQAPLTRLSTPSLLGRRHLLRSFGRLLGPDRTSLARLLSHLGHLFGPRAPLTLPLVFH